MRTFLTASMMGLFSLALVACGGDDDGGGVPDSAPAPDAGTPDAPPPPDAMVVYDAPPPWDARPPAPATITILNPADEPVPGIEVVFQSPQGDVLLHTQTDANGQASTTVDAGSFVTLALQDMDGTFILFTIGDVQPMDDIVIDNFGAMAPTPPADQTVTVAWDSQFNNMNQTYRISEGCGSADDDDNSALTPMMYDVSGSCLLPGGTNYHLIGQVVQESMFMSTALAHSVLLDNSGPAATMPAWSTSFQDVPLNIMGAPAGTAAVFGTTSLRLGPGEFDIADDNVGFGTTLSMNGKVPMGLAADAVTFTGAAVALAGGMNLDGIVLVNKNVAGVPTVTTNIDFAADGVRMPRSGTFSRTDPKRPRVSWTADVGSGNVTFTQLTLQWTDGGMDHTWSLITRPDTAGPIQMPSLPAALSAYEPTASSNFGANLEGVQLFYVYQSWVTETWHELRQRAGISATAQPDTDWTLSIGFPSMTAVMASPPPRGIEESLRHMQSVRKRLR